MGTGDQAPCAEQGVKRLTRVVLAVILATVILTAIPEWFTQGETARQRGFVGFIGVALDQKRLARGLEDLSNRRIATWDGDYASIVEQVRRTVERIEALERRLEEYRPRLPGLAGDPQRAVEARERKGRLLNELTVRVLAFARWRHEGGRHHAESLAHRIAISEARWAFAQEVNTAVDGAVRSSEASGRVFSVQFFVVFGAGLALLGGILWLFLVPAFRQIGESQQALGQYAERMGEANEELEAQRSQLEDTNAALEIAHQRLEGAGTRFRMLFLGLPVGCCGLGEDGRIYEWNRALELLLGRDAPGLFERNIGDLLRLKEPGAAWDRLMARVRDGGELRNVEASAVRPDGTEVAILVNVIPVLRAGGRIQSALASLMDVTEQQRLLEAVRNSEELARSALDSLQAQLALLDEQGNVVAVNQAWREFARENGAKDDQAYVSWNYLEVCGRAASEGVAGARAAMLAFDDILSGRSDSVDFEYLCPAGDEVRHFQARFSRFAGGDRARVLVVHEDVTERKRADARLKEYAEELEDANTRLHDLATRDALTGVANHYTFQREYERAFEQAVRQGRPLSLILMDVDHFKQYNDAFGHPAGDDVLRRVAAILSECVRQDDLLARYGGEEFVAILPGAGAESALAIAERICRMVASASWPLRQVTLSCGCATLTEDVGNRTDLVERADRALYRAKASGRDRVCVYAADWQRAA
jgi:diguanylate cyclase (GGDEF)-like protein/PAS domain S-box-containing protein